MVSVIVPNYNHARFLKERIDSILNQTYQDFELILLDDCSSDNSCDIINSYGNNPHVTHVVINEKNTGNTFLQWDRGVQLAKGKYIWIAESDDIARPELLENLVGELEKRPEASVAYCHSLIINAESQTIAEHNKENPSKAGKVTIHESRQFLRYLLNFNYIYNASMAVFRREDYARVNAEFKKFRYCGDWLFWACICSFGKVIEVHDMLSLFRQHQLKVTEKAKSVIAVRWESELKTIEYISIIARLTKIECICLSGRLTKRLKKAQMDDAEKRLLRNQFPSLCKGNIWHIVCYETGKNLFGFLKNYQNMSFLSQFFEHRKS